MKILNKLKLYQKIFLFAILFNIAVAVLDILSMKSGIFGNIDNYTNGIFCSSVCNWWNLFLYFNLISLGLISLFYYFFVRKDKSEAFSIFIASLILWFSGLPDILYFWLQGKSLPLVLNHLNNSIIIGRISSLSGFIYVTNISLLISAGIGLIASYFITKILKEKF